MVVLVGDMITEEALTYMNMLNTLDETRILRARTGRPGSMDEKGTAEENRHGDLMNKYMWMMGSAT